MTGRRRFLDVLSSLYIYNEHRGYSSIDRVIEAILRKCPEETDFLAAVRKHRADERKHYLMFRRWYEKRRQMPLFVDRTCGHIDRFVEIMFGSTIDRLDTDAVIANDDLFEKLCRVISLTEKRGYKQVEILLAHPLVRQDEGLMKIFRIIKQDEPSHWEPYDGWLRANGKREPKWWERAVDTFIHSELLFLKLPALFLNLGMRRRMAWADEGEAVQPTRMAARA